MTIDTAENTDIRQRAVNLYRLAFLLTGREDISVEIASDITVSGDYASPLFGDWMRAWQRRLVIGKALAAIHAELADSARRTQLARLDGSAMPARKWSLNPDTSEAELEKALLAIDLFPRVALLLMIFEGIRLADAATLLSADPALVRKAQAIGLQELTRNLGGKESQAPKRLGFWLRTVAVCN